MTFDGKVAIVTGAASGIGRATALRLGRDGAAVLCVDVNTVGAAATAAEISQGGGKGLAHRVDVTRRADVERMVRTAVEHFGRLDLLVNAAGIFRLTPAEAIGEDEWDLIMAVNAKGLFLCCQAALPVMRAQGRGRIVNIASSAARNGGFNSGAHYAASKGAVMAMTRRLAKEWAPYGIAVNAVNPGPIETPMTADWSPEAKQRVAESTPLGRFGQPEEVAEVVAFLLSDAASFVTAEAVEVNGGALIH